MYTQKIETILDTRHLAILVIVSVADLKMFSTSINEQKSHNIGT